LEEAEVTKEGGKEAGEEINPTAATRAKVRARVAKWDLNIAIFLFAVLIIVIILLFQEIGIQVVAPVALFGLAMVWLVGWRRGRELYKTFYDEELTKLEQELEKREKKKEKEGKIERAVEETIDEKIQKALRERWK